MRELRVVGVGADGSQVICQDAESGEKFTIAADEKLRAAARGDLSRLGQIEIEMTSTLRPREIQARIRAGATLAEVAAVAGVGVDKIERFAHPVLLERARAAELAALAHPFRHDGPSELTLGEAVAESLVAFGHNPSEATWDAWKGEDGYWAVQVGWHAGHTEHRAHWRYHPGSHGGTADPLDDLAEELTHPELIEPRRRLVPVAAVIAPVETTPALDMVSDGHEQVTVDADAVIDAQRTRQSPRSVTPADDGAIALDFEVADTADADHPDADHPDADADADTADQASADPTPESAEESGRQTAQDPAPQPAPSDPVAATPVDAPRRRKNRKPAVPAWEDVLLGVRSHPNS